MNTRELINNSAEKKPAITFEQWKHALRVYMQMRAVAEMDQYFAAMDENSLNESYDSGETPQETWRDEQESW